MTRTLSQTPPPHLLFPCTTIFDSSTSKTLSNTVIDGTTTNAMTDTADTDAINPTNSVVVEEQVLDGDSGSESNVSDGNNVKTKHTTDDVPVTTDDVIDGDDATDGDDDGGKK